MNIKIPDIITLDRRSIANSDFLEAFARTLTPQKSVVCLFWLLLSIHSIASADQFRSGPMFLKKPLNDQPEGERIYKNFDSERSKEKRKINVETVLRAQLTLYPNGTVNWFRPSHDLDTLSNKLAFEALRKAIQKSIPIKTLKGSKVPRSCMLTLSSSGKTGGVQIQEIDAAQGCFYKLSKQNEKQKFGVEYNQSLLIKTFSKLYKTSEKSLSGVWFRLNPDSSVDDYKMVDVSPETAQSSEQIKLELVRTIKNTKLNFKMISNNSAEPAGLLFIYDGGDKQKKLKLRIVLESPNDIVLSRS